MSSRPSGQPHKDMALAARGLNQAVLHAMQQQQQTQQATAPGAVHSQGHGQGSNAPHRPGLQLHQQHGGAARQSAAPSAVALGSFRPPPVATGHRSTGSYGLPSPGASSPGAAAGQNLYHVPVFATTNSAPEARQGPASAPAPANGGPGFLGRSSGAAASGQQWALGGGGGGARSAPAAGAVAAALRSAGGGSVDGVGPGGAAARASGDGGDEEDEIVYKPPVRQGSGLSRPSSVGAALHHLESHNYQQGPGSREAHTGSGAQQGGPGGHIMVGGLMVPVPVPVPGPGPMHRSSSNGSAGGMGFPASQEARGAWARAGGTGRTIVGSAELASTINTRRRRNDMTGC